MHLKLRGSELNLMKQSEFIEADDNGKKHFNRIWRL